MKYYNRMRFLVISDVHLYDEFDRKKFEFLKKIISSADRVIINGDFWDGFICSFSDFVNSDWKLLFPLLKSKKTVYIYGNHDRKIFSDDRVNLFSDSQLSTYDLKIKDKDYHFEHGNNLGLLLGKYDYLLFERKTFTKPRQLMVKYSKKMFGVLVMIFGAGLLRFLNEKFNKQIKRKIIKKFRDGQYFVFGHTHVLEADEKFNFLDSGTIQYGLGEYIMIDKNGFELKEEWYARGN